MAAQGGRGSIGDRAGPEVLLEKLVGNISGLFA